MDMTTQTSQTSEAPKALANPLGKESIPKLMVKFAIPSVISLLVNSLYNIVDQIFIGQGVGYLGNAATSILFPLTVVALAFALMVGDGTASYFSLKMGEGNRQQAEKAVSNAITLLILFAVFFLAAGLLFLQPLCTLCGATENTLPYALDYGKIIVLGFPLVIIGTGLNSVIRADGSPRVAMFSMIIGAVANTVLDPIFIFVFGWGVQGAALATILGQGLSLIVGLWYLPRFKNIRIQLKDLKPKAGILRTICSYGVSSFFTQVAIVACIIVINNMLVLHGTASPYGADIPVAALGIVMKVNQILISVVIGIAVGAQPIIGFNYGAKQLDRVKKALAIAIIISLVICTIGFFLFQFAPQSIINIFGQENALYNEFAQKCFRIFLLLCIPTAFQLTAGVFFQAIGRPLKSALITMSRQIIILIPAVIILPQFIGLEGVLWAGPLADGLSFVFSLTLVVFEMRKMTRQQAEFELTEATATA